MAQPMKLSFTQDVGETSPAKREAVADLCRKWIEENPVSRAGGRVYEASVAAR